MTSVVIAVHQPYARGHLDMGAVASVRLLAELDGSAPDAWWQIDSPVPVSGDAAERSVDVDLPRGGHYSVAVTFPRGEDVVRQVQVLDGEALPVTIELDVSPHEYLAWQQFSGAVRLNPYQRETSAAPTGSIGLTDSRADGLLIASDARLRDLYDDTREVPTAATASVPSDASAWTLVGAPGAGGNPAFDGPTPVEWPDARWDDEFAAWFHTPTRDEGLALVRGLRGEPASAGLRLKFPRWIAFRTSGAIDLASVPWAWWGGQRSDDEELQLFYDRVRPSPVEPEVAGRLRISVRDQRWFGLLEYMGSGRLLHAKQLFDSAFAPEYPSDLFGAAESALYGKTKGPLVATAGAIMLVADATSDLPQSWDPWLDNLANWFPEIPDGPILLGYRRAEQARNSAALERAFGHLRDGIERGIPFFSATLGLASLALARLGDDVAGVDEAMRTIAAVSSRVDPGQPFTVVRLR